MTASAITEETIRQLVDRFYGKVRKDAQLAPIFNNAIGTDEAEWQPHLQRMYDFWSSVMLSGGRYRGTPMKKHQDLPAFDATLFDRWLKLFEETARELHTPDIAERYIAKSRMIAESLKYGLYYRPAELTAVSG